MKAMKKLLYILIFLAIGNTAWAQVTISTAEEWNTFASNVNSGTTYSGQTVTLTADITITTGAGSSSTNSFKGTFEGGGHTLTLNLTHSSGGDAWIAPFKFINGATIKHLHTAGTITTDGKMAGGIVGDSWGTSTIQSCRSSVTISSSISGDGTHGGLVGRVNDGTLTINDCLFDGSITGAGTNSCGGFVGWKEASLVLNRCLQAGDLSGIDSDGGATFSRYNSGSVNFSTCYYRTAHGTDNGKPYQGTQTSATGSTLQGLLGSAWEVSGNDVLPIMDAKNLAIATISGLSRYYLYTGSVISIAYDVTDANGSPLTKGTHYTETISPSATVQAEGDYTLTITGTDPYYGTREYHFSVLDGIPYVDAAGVEHTVQAVPLDNTMTTLSEGTYVVNSNVTFTQTVTTTGNVTLILADGCTMSIGTEDDPLLSSKCMDSPYDLTIYGQALGTGYLKMYTNVNSGIDMGYGRAYTQHSGNVVIVNHSGPCIYQGNVTLDGGTLDVESSGNGNGDIYAQTISILGGKLWAREKGLYGSGGITLGFTNPTDLIYVYNSKYNPNGWTFKITDGQTLVDEYGIPYSGTLQLHGPRYFDGDTLRPVTGVTLTKNEYDYNDVSATFDGTSTTTVSIPVDVHVTSVTYNRTFTAGTAATVMLPFDYTCNGEEGGSFYTFAGVSGSSPVMKDSNRVTSLTANTPYLFVPTSTTMSFPNIENMTDGQVTLKPTAGEDHDVTSSVWELVGSYTARTWAANEVENIFRLDEGILVPMEAGMVTKPTDCYLQWTGSGYSDLDVTLVQGTNDGVTAWWGTFYNGTVNYTLSDGAAAYTMGTDYKLYRLGTDGRAIPAGTAVVIIAIEATPVTPATDPATATITLTPVGTVSATDHAYGGNQLYGSDSAVAVTAGQVQVPGSDPATYGTPYVLSISGGTIGFRQFTGSEIPAGKAYYVVTL
ncbi:MAG: hypothetical protein J5669_01190 [Bacteroidales bacterium]|nr:hypothetical protein [Bacteroidales bacterium]